MNLFRRLSLRVRLTLLFMLLSAVAWCFASVIAWKQTTDKLDKLFDTQQMLFAKRISAMDFADLPTSRQWIRAPKKVKHGHLDEDALAFAIYTVDGKMVLHDGENGPFIPYHYRREGFDDGHLSNDDDSWRFLWLTTADKKYRIVVGQEWDYRQEMALDIITGQLTPWLVALPVTFLLLILLISRELAPLKKLTRTLRQRHPDSGEPLDTHGVPNEVRPMLDALNLLFRKTHDMMTRERRFTSDAAHELRSPLTALRVQAEVAQLSQDDPESQQKALMQLHAGIDRATRLVEQLLTLSRLDSLEQLADVQTVNLGDLLQSSVMDIYHTAQKAGIEIRLHLNAQQVTRTAQPLLMSLLVRNLLDNAIRYSPSGSVVDVTVDSHGFSVRDNGPGIQPEALARIGERFYRPPGQDETGSGLGLSIVQRIATLHGMTATFANAPGGGFEVTIRG